VCIALSAVRLADHPGDSAAAFHLAHSSIAQRLGLPSHEPLHARRASSMLRARFSSTGVVRTLLWLRTLMHESMSDADSARYEQLVNLAQRHNTTPLPTLGGFEQLARNSKIASPTGAAVRVMTIHGSKGLEFDAVILPELDEKLSRSDSDLFLIEREPTTKEITAVFRRHRLAHLLHPRLSAIEHAASAQDLHERMCVLYVAMTRARESLDMIIDAHPPPEDRAKAKFPRTFAGFLREKLAPDLLPMPASTLWQLGEEARQPDPTHRGRSAVPPSNQRHRSERPILLRPPTQTPLSQLLRRTPSGTASHQSTPAFLRPQNLAATARGHVFHAWLQSLEWLTGPLPSSEDLVNRAGQILSQSDKGRSDVSRSTLTQWANELRSALAKPTLARVLSRSNAGELLGSDDLRVFREHRFAIRERNPGSHPMSLLVGQIDRLVVAYRGSTAIAADVVDFKTDATSTDASGNLSDAHSAIMSRYEPQLRDYRDAVGQIFRLKAQAVHASLFLIGSDTQLRLQ